MLRQNSTPTFSISHAVKEDPVTCVWSMFDKGHIVACLDAEHSEQLQAVSGERVGDAAVDVAFGDIQGCRPMGETLRVRVHLGRNTDCYGKIFKI